MQKKLILSGNSLTCVANGNVYTNTNATVEDYHNALNAADEDELRQLFNPELYAKEEALKEEIKKAQDYQSGWEMLHDTSEFEIREDSVYMVGINRSIPQLLISKFCEIVGRVSGEYYKKYNDVDHVSLHADSEYNALKRFWKWTILNPRSEVADSLFNFLENNHLRINSQGFFYALRNVVKVSADDTLVKFISEQYTKIKLRKKGPGNYNVYKENNEYILYKNDEELALGDLEEVGNLKDLYLNLPNMEQNRYTDAHTRTFDIRIGQKVSMPLEDCNWTTADCGHAGLHFTMDQIHYVGCGDTSVIVLINPMKVVGIGSSKGRCYEYLPIATIPRAEATEFLRNGDFDTLEMEAEFAKEETEDLENRVKEGFSVEAKKYSFSIPSITSEEVKSIVLDLQGVKDIVANRVNNFEETYYSNDAE